MVQRHKDTSRRNKGQLTALDFFCGSGLVTEGLRPHFQTIWANDICPKKSSVYTANFGAEHLVTESIVNIKGSDVPAADLGWASFPCQDLSLAGNMEGLSNSERSGLYWEWLRVLDQMTEASRPRILCAENVVGFLVADEGAEFRQAYRALRERGYRAGALTINAVNFVPQSRPRSFLVAIREGYNNLEELDLAQAEPGGPYHTKAVMTAWKAAGDSAWIWWKLPGYPSRKLKFEDLVEWDAPVDPQSETDKLLRMLSPINRHKLRDALTSKVPLVGTGYKRIRSEDGTKHQRLEIRFDGVAGCLRTPEGGSSRQQVLIIKDRKVRTRLLTVRETARLMGARDSFKLPGGYNDAYRAMGDAVVVPVTRWLARHLLSKLATVKQAAECEAV